MKIKVSRLREMIRQEMKSLSEGSSTKSGGSEQEAAQQTAAQTLANTQSALDNASTQVVKSSKAVDNLKGKTPDKYINKKGQTNNIGGKGWSDNPAYTKWASDYKTAEDALAKDQDNERNSRKAHNDAQNDYNDAIDTNTDDRSEYEGDIGGGIAAKGTTAAKGDSGEKGDDEEKNESLSLGAIARKALRKK
tara:strand:- start:932 stop:1507 length:576 start_codon:yes stop_codon:yes gene_type:complete